MVVSHPNLTALYIYYKINYNSHQNFYNYFFQTNQNNKIFQKIAEKIIRNKCSKIYNEALYIANDLDMLEKYKDLFIEQSTRHIHLFYFIKSQ